MWKLCNGFYDRLIDGGMDAPEHKSDFSTQMEFIDSLSIKRTPRGYFKFSCPVRAYVDQYFDNWLSDRMWEDKFSDELIIKTMVGSGYDSRKWRRAPAHGLATKVKREHRAVMQSVAASKEWCKAINKGEQWKVVK